MRRAGYRIWVFLFLFFIFKNCEVIKHKLMGAFWKVTNTAHNLTQALSHLPPKVTAMATTSIPMMAPVPATAYW